MSHKKIRSDKTCLNCGHEVEERFCSHCGQQNLELDDSVVHLVIHYIQDLFHYDGKLWHTLKSLMTRPGLVAKEYMEGKRQSHLEPIKFYVFASSVFFLAFFFVLGKNPVEKAGSPRDNYAKRLFHLKQEKTFLAGSPDTAYINLLIDSLKARSGDTISLGQDNVVGDVEIELFDVPQDTGHLGWLGEILEERVMARTTQLEEEHEGDESQATRALMEELMHTLPQLFFLSLPFFALFLKLLYWRSRRTSYVEHFIFSIYHYAYLFVIMLTYILVVWLMDKMDLVIPDSIIEWMTLGLMLYPFIYLWLSMKRFYTDRWSRLVIRYFILLFLLMVIIIGLFLLLVVVTFLW